MTVHSGKLQEGYQAALQLLGGTASNTEIQTALESVLQSGQQSTRIYHRAEHFEEIAGSKTPETIIEAVRFRAGLYHDVVYQHVDAGGEHQSGFAPDVANTLGLLIGRAMDGSMHLNPTRDTLHQGIMHVFGVKAGEALNARSGKNEILSAMFGAEEGRNLGVADKYLLAEAAHIEGTIPFKSATHFEGLKARLAEANERFIPEGERLSPSEIDRVIESAVEMANLDVGGFKSPFPDFIENTRELLAEEAPGGADALDDPLVLWSPITKQSRFFTDLVAPQSLAGTMRVYHAIGNTPPAAELERDEAIARDNIRGLGDYLNANAASIALASALQVKQGNPLPTSLNALFGTKDFTLHSHATSPTDIHQGALTACAGDSLMSDRFAAELLSGLGSATVKTLRENAEASGMFNPAATSEARARSAEKFLRDAEQILGSVGATIEQAPAKKKLLNPVKSHDARTGSSMENILETLRDSLTSGDGVRSTSPAAKPSRGRG